MEINDITNRKKFWFLMFFAIMCSLASILIMLPGDSSLSGESTDVSADTANTEYVLNVNTKKFHKPTCSAAKQMKEENKQDIPVPEMI